MRSLAAALLLCAPLTAALPALPAPPAPAPPVPPRDPTEPLRLLARLAAADPPVAQVQAAAARLAEAEVPDPSALAARRRLAALLPRLSAEVQHDERSYRVTGLQGSSEVDYARSSPGTSVTVRATWELPDLVASRGEPSAASATLSRLRRRDEAVRRATELLFERRRLRLALLLEPPAEPLARAEAELAVDRLTAELDAATGGLVSGWGGR